MIPEIIQLNNLPHLFRVCGVRCPACFARRHSDCRSDDTLLLNRFLVHKARLDLFEDRELDATLDALVPTVTYADPGPMTARPSSVTCPRCHAVPHHACSSHTTRAGNRLLWYHQERWFRAERADQVRAILQEEE